MSDSDNNYCFSYSTLTVQWLRIMYVLTGTAKVKLLLLLYIDSCCIITYTLCLKNDNDVLCYNFNAHQPILIILVEILLNEYAIKW